MQEDLFKILLREIPIAGVMSFFGWAMLQIFKQVMLHYQHMIDERLVELTRVILELSRTAEIQQRKED